MSSAPENDEGLTITYSSGQEGAPDLRLIHYNDVYHVESGSSDPIGGVERFQTVMNQYRSAPRYSGLSEVITLFSGDVFNPSLESTVTKGQHMVPFLNKIGTDVACIGNHDLDFGVAQFRHLRSQCKFPWLLANVIDPALGDDVPLANCEKTVMLTSSNGIKIGVIGLGEREWLGTINSLPPDLIYKSASQTAIELVPKLREQGAEIVIALTHQREPNDIKLAEKVPAGFIDIILGGHDHFYAHSVINGTHVLRSGTDFRQLSYIEAFRKPNSKGWDFNITRREIVRSIPPDSEIGVLVDKLTSTLKAKLEKPVGYTASALDGRFTTVRTRESNLGNFICDLMRFYYHADCAIMAGGTIRGDQVYPPGLLRLKDVLNCFPFEDPVVVLKVTGREVVEALENGVSQLPALEGRFPQVSNITFEYTASSPPGSRINWVKLGGEPINYKQHYTLATRGYMARGKDGYTSLLVQSEGGEIEELVSEENGMLISAILRQYFLSLKVMGKWRRMSKSLHKHWDGVHSRLHAQIGGSWIKTPSPAVERKEPNMSSHFPANSAAFKTTTTTTTTVEYRIQHTHLKHKPRPHLRRYGRYYEPHRHHAHDDTSTKQKSETSLSASYPSSDDSSATKHSIDSHLDSDSDSEPEILVSSHEERNYVTTTAKTPAEEEQRIRLARKVLKKWMRIAGVHGKTGVVEEAGEEFTPSWTWGIAPRCEGRILVRTRVVEDGGVGLGEGKRTENINDGMFHTQKYILYGTVS
ncbi:5'-nucleotidase, putative [Talaromyces stipitatus ATCC 10500]|uniref:5'-nucleotidase, putative n=1 Tax=Talaromyces stipitatus (strain ATCC 10500 / CBS 375.48 / QM 6759 / NRRL 1006) TaxID=441959 RepID=B8M157_TALSN|nr:5'-nucleotidase, putative [Talaromyces stipitatus ATCC 10500]EED20999.1 5'-nucleotidase, putative [Talaromyces stipitatus ATCC 10500]